jgi:CubicO group peptidase (beta-lactamase class C family)
VDGIQQQLARHFLAPDTEEPAAPYPVIVRPAGGLITSADDLAAVVAMLLRRGEPLLSSASVARMEVPATSRAARAGLAVGYGLGVYGEMDRGLRWLGHRRGHAVGVGALRVPTRGGRRVRGAHERG